MQAILSVALRKPRDQSNSTLAIHLCPSNRWEKPASSGTGTKTVCSGSGNRPTASQQIEAGLQRQPPMRAGRTRHPCMPNGTRDSASAPRRGEA